MYLLYVHILCYFELLRHPNSITKKGCQYPYLITKKGEFALQLTMKPCVCYSLPNWNKTISISIFFNYLNVSAFAFGPIGRCWLGLFSSKSHARRMILSRNTAERYEQLRDTIVNKILTCI